MNNAMPYTKEEKTEIVNRICTLIADKNYSLRAALREDGMPGRNTFFEWIDADEKKANQYARATEIRAENMAEEILQIADDQEGDIIEDEDGKEIVNYNVINRARLRVDSRKWLMSKMFPKKYGDKVENKNVHSGEIKIIRQIVK